MPKREADEDDQQQQRDGAEELHDQPSTATANQRVVAELADAEDHAEDDRADDRR